MPTQHFQNSTKVRLGLSQFACLNDHVIKTCIFLSNSAVYDVMQCSILEINILWCTSFRSTI